MGRDMGPSWAVPSIRAGGAVLEPLPSIWIFTFGYCLRNPSAQRVIRLFRVSEPMLLRVPDTPLDLAYDLRLGSSLMASSAKVGPAMIAMAITNMNHASQGMLSLF